MRIRLENICVTFRRNNTDVNVLDGFSLEVLPGEFVALAGRSGSGKSTAIAVGYGLLTPCSGEVTWGDTPFAALTKKKRQEIRRSSIGYASQDALVFEDLCVLSNVVVGGGSEERAEALLDRLDLAHLCNMRAGKLSGGERQRVTVARALAKSPSLILMDEPTSSLDAKAASHVVALLREAADEGAAVLVATHDDLIKEAASRVVSL